MDNLLPLLAIETSGDICSAAIMLGENSFVEMNYLQKHIHSKKLIDIIDTILKTAELEINDLNAIAVSGGPGSFTGLRIGYSSAKGLAFGANKGIIPVPSFDAFAMQISENLIPGTEFIIANKAGSEEYYTGKFLLNEIGKNYKKA